MKILTLNIWGAPYSQHRMARIKRICERVQQEQPDIILLQEAFLTANLDYLREQLSPMLQYHHHFASGIIGSGLITFSRYPITNAAFHRFRLGGKPERITQGDYFAGKGIGMVQITTPQGELAVYNCHTHAQYDYWDDDNEYAVYTETNLYEAARFINATAGDLPVILGGDLNVSPTQPGYEVITTVGQLVDAYPHLHGEHDITFSADNPYTTHEHQCLDYLMVRGVAIDDIAVTMTEFFTSGTAKAYSDHFGVMATFHLGDDDALYPPQHDIEPVLTRLQQRVSIALAETENEQYGHYERAFVAVLSLLDTYLATGFLSRWFGGIAKGLRRIIPVFVIAYALYQMLQGGINLQGRKNVLQAIHDELSHRLEQE